MKGAVAARLQDRICRTGAGRTADVDEVRRLRTRRTLHAVLYSSVAVFMVVSLLVLSGAEFLVMAIWALGYAVFLTLSMPFLRQGRTGMVAVLINGGLTLLLASAPIMVGVLPPAAHLPLMLMILAAAFVESARGVLLVYGGAVACLVCWTVAGLPTDNTAAVNLFAILYLTVSGGLAMVGAARYSAALQELSNGLAEREHLASKVQASNEQLELAVAERTAELHQVIAEKNDLVQKLARQALTDDLTGLRNRAGFTEVLREVEAPAGQQMWLAMIDLDGLKDWNDTFGHLLGDEALRGVGRALQSIAGPNVNAARISGDEFAVLFVGMDCARVSSMCWTVVDRVEHALTIPVGDSVRSPGISVGLATFDPAAAHESAGRADRALYAAKRAGGRRVQVATEDAVDVGNPQDENSAPTDNRGVPTVVVQRSLPQNRDPGRLERPEPVGLWKPAGLI